MSKYEVKGVKFHNGHEGETLAQCSLYRDGVKIALYSDGDWGSEAQFTWMDRQALKVEVKTVQYDGTPFAYQGTPEEALFAAHCAAIPMKFDDTLKKPVATTPDLFVSDLIEEYHTSKRFARFCKKETLFRVKGDQKGEYRTVKAPFSKRVKDYLTAKYGTSIEEIYNEKLVPAGSGMTLTDW
jgi:hypothetical protein